MFLALASDRRSQERGPLNSISYLNIHMTHGEICSALKQLLYWCSFMFTSLSLAVPFFLLAQCLFSAESLCSWESCCCSWCLIVHPVCQNINSSDRKVWEDCMTLWHLLTDLKWWTVFNKEVRIVARIHVVSPLKQRETRNGFLTTAMSGNV